MAAAACARATTMIAQNNHSCTVSDNSCNAWSRGEIGGTRTTPNQRNGNPEAEFTTQPLIGTANNNRYSKPCVMDAMRCCQCGVLAMSGGAPAHSCLIYTSDAAD